MRLRSSSHAHHPLRIFNAESCALLYFWRPIMRFWALPSCFLVLGSWFWHRSLREFFCVATWWPARSSSDLQWMLLDHIVLWDKLMPCRVMLCESRHARVHQMNRFYLSSRIGGVAGVMIWGCAWTIVVLEGKKSRDDHELPAGLYIYIWTIWRFQKLGYPQISSIWFSDFPW